MCKPPPPDISIKAAASRGNIEAVKQHLAAGTDVNAKDEGGDTPLDWATAFRRTEIADLLRKHGGKTGKELPSLTLWEAVRRGGLQEVKDFLANGADVNAKRGGSAGTPLHSAANRGHKEVAELLIANGADVNEKDEYGYTPLHQAAWGGHTEVTELLIANGADVNAKSNEQLVVKGNDVNVKSKRRGRTPLDGAIRRKHPETAALLRKHGGKRGEELKAEGK